MPLKPCHPKGLKRRASSTRNWRCWNGSCASSSQNRSLHGTFRLKLLVPWSVKDRAPNTDTSGWFHHWSCRFAAASTDWVLFLGVASCCRQVLSLSVWNPAQLRDYPYWTKHLFRLVQFELYSTCLQVKPRIAQPNIPPGRLHSTDARLFFKVFVVAAIHQAGTTRIHALLVALMVGFF